MDDAVYLLRQGSKSEGPGRLLPARRLRPARSSCASEREFGGDITDEIELESSEKIPVLLKLRKDLEVCI